MRLICPNCDAEYQVDDAAIPETGRDVQCSNCGHAWFQLHADAERAREAEAEVFGDAADKAPEPAAVMPPPELAPAPGLTAVPMAAPAPIPAAAEADGLADDLADDLAAGDADADTPRPTAARQTLAESVLSVLREEAERETAVRREETPAPRPVDDHGAFETQTELGLEAAPSPSASATARHLARLKGTNPDPQPEPKAAARRDLLPDIEEINSTLRANSDRVQEEMDAEVDALPDLKPRRRGFRSGFVLMMVLAVVLATAYVMAPRIIAQMPGAAPAMRSYVATVDRGRLWLDGMMKSASGSLRSLSGDGN